VTKTKASRPIVPPTFFVKLLLPFAIPMLLTVALVIIVGESWPRNIAPGSGLKMWGFGASALTSLIVWRFITRSIGDMRVHKVAAVICAVVGVMGWPVWTVGVLPSVNGFSLGRQETVRMTLTRTEITTISRSRAVNHWAWMRPEAPTARAKAGRYFISEQTYQRWNDQRPSTVNITVSKGLLGAQVVTGSE
jgi:hypothetical protein